MQNVKALLEQEIPACKSIKNPTLISHLDTLPNIPGAVTKAQQRKMKAAMLHLDLDEVPGCMACGKPVPYANANHRSAKRKSHIFGGWVDFCSSECSRSSPILREKAKETCLERYGVTHHMHRDELKERYRGPRKGTQKETKRQQNMRENNLKKYGVEYHTQTDEWKNKMDFGALGALGAQGVQKMYSEASPEEIQEIVSKREKTHEMNHGYRNPLQVPDMKLQVVATKMTIDGKVPEWVKAYRKGRVREFLIDLIAKHDNDRRKCQVALGVNYRYFSWMMRKYDLSDVFPPLTKTSADERELFEWCEQEFPSLEVRSGVRGIIGKRELDILIDNRVAIEYNGIYWHSSLTGTEPDYHLRKTNDANTMGIQLYHIEDELWETKKEIVKSMIRKAVGVNIERICASKCTIADISAIDSERFMEKCHISGYRPAKVRIGLFYGGRLVQALIAGKNNSSEGGVEIYRISSELNTEVRGGTEKLLSHLKAIPKFSRLVFLQDRRYGGFPSDEMLSCMVLEKTSAPNWYGFHLKHSPVLGNRMTYQKQRLLQDPNFIVSDSSKSDREILMENGYGIYYDCGHHRFVC